MAVTSVTIRGSNWDVEYRDYGYEPDTNAHDIDWWFVGAQPDDLSEDEELDIYDQLACREPDHFDDDVI